MTLVVISALAVFVAPRFSSSGFQAAAFHQELLTAARYAQKHAIASGCEVQVAVGANNYALFYPNNTDGNTATCDAPVAFGANAVNHPVQTGNYAGATPGGITIAGFGNFFFDSSGSPSASGTILINPGARPVIIEAVTGFAH